MLRLVILIFLAISTPAIGQSIPVRSGAHDGFTRLVLDLPQDSLTWQATPIENGIRVSIPTHSYGFNLSRAFDRITRDYVNAIVQSTDAVEIIFGCDCEASVYAEGARMVVIDVALEEPQQGSISNPSEQPDLRFFDNSPLKYDPPTESRRLATPNAVVSEPAVEAQLLSRENAPQPIIEVKPTDESLEEASSLEDVKSRLARQFSQAATRGLLQPSEDTLPSALQRPDSQVDPSAFDFPSSNKESEPVQGIPAGNVRITPSTNLPPANVVLEADFSSADIRCPDPNRVSVQNWGYQDGFLNATALGRLNLYSDFNQLDVEAALELAKIYLHYGFGAEARRTLQLDEELSQGYPELLEIAHLMDYTRPPSTSFLSQFANCNSDVALWGILALPEATPTPAIAVDASIRALDSLPIYLRTIFAPALSKKLSRLGEAKGAAAALRILERSKNSLPVNATLAKAQLELSEGDHETAQTRLSKVIASNTEQSARALIQLVDSSLEADTRIDSKIVDLIRAYSLELRNHPISADLNRAYTFALAKSGRFVEAFGILRDIKLQESGNFLSEWSPLFELLAREASDAVFLSFTFAASFEEISRLTDLARLNIADRLQKLGFPTQAKAVLDSLPRVPVTPDRQLLMARILLSLSKPDKAIALLSELELSGAKEVFAQAMIKLEQYSEAHSALSATGNLYAARQVAWLSEYWTQLVSEDEEVLSSVVTISNTKLEGAGDNIGILARVDAALTESASARRALSELLGKDFSMQAE